MPLKSWMRHPIGSFKGWQERRRRKNEAQDLKRRLPLREFVYLDAVSLHSLLVSQMETIPEAITQAISRADEAELIGSMSASVGSELIGKAESQISGRYQTSNSDSTQSSRKAVIQTLFKELREQPLDFKLVAPERVASLEAPSELKDAKSNVADAASNFTRGTLVEVEVVLAVDPVFKLGAMMNEWSAMADVYPTMFSAHGVLGFLRESEPIMKILDRFLAGLIPIKATAVNYVAVKVDGVEYIAHKDAIQALGLEARPLRITGVTEHLGFWKDVRRVLFSEARFTMLCRVARDGLHDKWTPVKLADLFSEVAPDFVDQINAVRAPSANDAPAATAQGRNLALADALLHYKRALTPDGMAVTEADSIALAQLVAQLSISANDATSQRAAFDRVREFTLLRHGIQAPDADADLEARRDARGRAGLELFPTTTPPLTVTKKPMNTVAPEEVDDGRILDTEVIAIYW